KDSTRDSNVNYAQGIPARTEASCKISVNSCAVGARASLRRRRPFRSGPGLYVFCSASESKHLGLSASATMGSMEAPDEERLERYCMAPESSRGAASLNSGN